jgi:hypothetical protein
MSGLVVHAMLVPLTRKSFEELLPAVATGNQYIYCWGKLKDVLQRLLISVVGLFGVLILYLVSGYALGELFLISGIVVGLYWLWQPAIRATLNNQEYRRYGYAGFWQGKVTDIFISEELVGSQDTVNNRGDLVVVENRERCLNLEVGDRSGFTATLQVPLKRAYRAIDVGDSAQMLVFSSRSDLGRISNHSDIYIPDHNLWVSDYPFVQRDVFVEVSRRLNARYLDEAEAEASPPPKRTSRRTPQSDRPTRLQDDWENEERLEPPQSRDRKRTSQWGAASLEPTDEPSQRQPRQPRTRQPQQDRSADDREDERGSGDRRSPRQNRSDRAALKPPRQRSRPRNSSRRPDW